MLYKWETGYLCRSSEVKLFPIQVFSMAQHLLVGQGICDEVDIVSHQSASENVTMFPLICSQELKRIGTKFQSTSQVRNQAILQRWFTHLSVRHKHMISMGNYTLLFLLTPDLNFHY